jgi:hypothetical protein
VNSSRAPESPLSRIRSKPWWVFKCAKRISTRVGAIAAAAVPYAIAPGKPDWVPGGFASNATAELFTLGGCTPVAVW